MQILLILFVEKYKIKNNFIWTKEWVLQLKIVNDYFISQIE